MARIVLIGEEDWIAFRDIRLRSLLDSPDAFGSTYGQESSASEDSWREWAAGRWRDGTAAVFLAEDEGRAVGTATGAAYDAAPGDAHVYAMWVAPDARGAGIGRALLDAVVRWARDRACGRLALTATEMNAAARAFYGACGFVETGNRAPLREGSALDVLTMIRELR